MQESERTRLQLLANGLILFGMEEESALLIIQMLVGKPEKREELLMWMAENENAKPEEITEQAIKIVTSKGGSQELC